VYRPHIRCRLGGSAASGQAGNDGVQDLAHFLPFVTDLGVSEPDRRQASGCVRLIPKAILCLLRRGPVISEAVCLDHKPSARQ
jgi:hypothetical protein